MAQELSLATSDSVSFVGPPVPVLVNSSASGCIERPLGTHRALPQFYMCLKTVCKQERYVCNNQSH
ncbi:hypothetical protein E2562_020266 [Oryza meyeriana var. granulata]|uniref:Uncharacterized protein n=1 Tax=Oryza meyeriana var. granulata TaxID=110450 RepID=A0A6G1DN48_9ORYZ|nr:hypothetical protein E2562_020266 [Oryza meyeriana var. granulata]